jgi:hypothetical protein
MSIVLVGGMDRLGAQYQKEAKKLGMQLEVFSQLENNMSKRIRAADAVIIFTNMVSHKARHQAVEMAKESGIPVFMHHACGVCSLRQCLKCLSIIDCSNKIKCPMATNNK